MSGYYSKLTFKELLDEYFDARLDYWNFQQHYGDNESYAETGSILIQNYQEIETEIERRITSDC